MLRSLEDLRAQGQVARLVLAAKDWVKEASSGIGELASHLGGGGGAMSQGQGQGDHRSPRQTVTSLLCSRTSGRNAGVAAM